MNRNRLIAETLTRVGEAESTDEKLYILRANDSSTLRAILRGALDERIVFNTKVPTYRVPNAVDGYAANNLHKEYRRFHHFVEGQSIIKDPKKRENLLAQILESIDASEALVVEAMINKDLANYGVTRELALEAFPDLMPS